MFFFFGGGGGRGARYVIAGVWDWVVVNVTELRPYIARVLQC